jgi:predicted ABC-type ATPase
MAPLTAEEIDDGIRRLQAILGSPQSHSDYARLPDSYGGKLLDVDLARLLFPEYAASRDGKADWTVPMHPYVSSWVYREFARRILIQPPTGFALLLAGGGGSGKSTLVAGTLAQLRAACELAIDGVMADRGLTFERLDDILDSRRQIVYVYVYTPFETAIERVRARQRDTGRPVPDDVLAKAHVGALNTFLAIHRAFGHLPEVTMQAYDTTAVPPRVMSIADVRARRYTRLGESVEATAARLLASLPGHQP